DEMPFAQAPTALKDELADLKYKPAIAVGVAFRPSSMLTLSGDFRQQLGDGLALEPKSHLGAGAELRLLPILPLRGGFAVVTGGTLLSWGAGLELGVLNISAAAASRGGDVLGMVGISFGGRPR
ncbi:MAG: hypothetical protein HY701_01145, partial [Gemmatimonadetes bacterium]|nr:hypothetical protein [Gemmatimonadota bacterium]